MKRYKFYAGDPLAGLLLDRVRLTPVRLALIAGLVFFGGALLISWASGTLVSQPDQIGFLADWSAWIWNLLFAPVVFGYYLWASNAMEELIQGLEQGDAVTISETDVRSVIKAYRQPWRKFLAIGVAVAVSVPFFVAREDVIGWIGTEPAPRLAATVTFGIGAYAVTMLTMALLTNIWALRRILRDKEYRINPLHPDRCGGLKALSTYALKTAYLAAVFGLLVGLSEYRFITQGLSQDYWYMHLGIPLYIAGASLFFFAPLDTAHGGMKKAKEELLNKIARQFRDDYLLVHRELDSHEEALEEEVTKIKQLRALYELTDEFPVWPFDVATLRRFGASVITPFVPLVIGWLWELLTRQFS